MLASVFSSLRKHPTQLPMLDSHLSDLLRQISCFVFSMNSVSCVSPFSQRWSQTMTHVMNMPSLIDSLYVSEKWRGCKEMLQCSTFECTSSLFEDMVRFDTHRFKAAAMYSDVQRCKLFAHRPLSMQLRVQVQFSELPCTPNPQGISKVPTTRMSVRRNAGKRARGSALELMHLAKCKPQGG